MGKEFDVVVFGATGFTGSLVANYYLRTYGVENEVKWAIAGRSQEKLDRVVSALRLELGDDALRIPIILADASDPPSLRAMAERTRVVLSTVGPYLTHGSALVAAVASLGTDYVDLTGESLWVRRMEAEHGDVARKTGSRIVHSCGFDCIPSDLGTLVAVEALMRDTGAVAERVETYITDALGGFSGGTMATAMTVFAYPEQDARAIQDPYYLAPVPAGSPRLDATDYDYNPSFSPRMNRWTGFTTLSPVNAHVVRRTAHLLGHKYGYFRYTERLAPLDGPGGLIACIIASYGFLALISLGTNALTRPLLRRVLPSPGQGPSREDMLRGYFKLVCFAESGPGLDASGPVNGAADRSSRPDGAMSGPVGGLKSSPVGVDDGAKSGSGEGTAAGGGGSTSRRMASVTVSGQGDPGYWLTSQMIAESALCLAKDGVDCPGGSLTPGACMGMALVERLQERGVLKFTVTRPGETVNMEYAGKGARVQDARPKAVLGSQSTDRSARGGAGRARLTSGCNAKRSALPRLFLTGGSGLPGRDRCRLISGDMPKYGASETGNREASRATLGCGLHLWAALLGNGSPISVFQTCGNTKARPIRAHQCLSPVYVKATKAAGQSATCRFAIV